MCMAYPHQRIHHGTLCRCRCSYLQSHSGEAVQGNPCETSSHNHNQPWLQDATTTASTTTYLVKVTSRAVSYGTIIAGDGDGEELQLYHPDSHLSTH